MRRINWRMVIFGGLLLILAMGFFFFMMIIAPTSNDPVELMKTVGSASGTVGGVSIVLIILGLIGKKS